MAVTARDVMQTDLVTVRSSLLFTELDDVLLRHRIHGAPVVDDGKLVGIVSRSDMVRQVNVEEERIAASAFYFEPADADDHREADRVDVIQAAASRVAKLHVRDAMIVDLISVAPEEDLQQVARKMLERRVHRILVTEGDALLGMVSSLDLVRLIAEGRAQIG